MPRVDAEHKAERRAQIVDAARRCFARDGFHRTTLSDVFAEAGLSAGCVYNYFQSKDQLILAIAEQRHERELRVLDDSAKTDDPLLALRRIARRFVDEYLGARGLERRKIAVQTWSESMRSPAILDAVLQGLEAPRREIADTIRRGQRSGALASDLDADASSRALIALFHGFLLQKLWDPKLDVESCFAVFERMLASLG